MFSTYSVHYPSITEYRFGRPATAGNPLYETPVIRSSFSCEKVYKAAVSTEIRFSSSSNKNINIMINVSIVVETTDTSYISMIIEFSILKI